jgi:hypothetical protein
MHSGAIIPKGRAEKIGKIVWNEWIPILKLLYAFRPAGVDVKLPLQSETAEGLGLLLSACSADA